MVPGLDSSSTQREVLERPKTNTHLKSQEKNAGTKIYAGFLKRSFFFVGRDDPGHIGINPIYEEDSVRRRTRLSGDLTELLPFAFVCVPYSYVDPFHFVSSNSSIYTYTSQSYHSEHQGRAQRSDQFSGR
jgi:hypothetical protein